MDTKRQVIIKLLLITIFCIIFIGTLERFKIISFSNNNLPEAICLNKVEVGVKKNESTSLVATIYPLNSFKGKIEWESNNKEVADVTDDGVVYGKNEGIATITASIPYNKLSISSLVYVTNEDIPLESFTLTTNEINLLLDSTYDINYQVYPLNSNSKSLYFVSSDENIITVDNLGHIIAKAIGTAFVKVYSLNGQKELLKVNVLEKNINNKIEVSTNNINLNIGSKYKINTNNRDVYWESLNPNIAKVDNGMVEAISDGNTKIFAKLSDENLKIIDVQVTPHKVNVGRIKIKEKELELYQNDTYEVTVGILPLNATVVNLEYVSNDPNIATINDGIIKGVGLGSTEIVITDTNSGIYDTMVVTVYENPNDVVLDDFIFASDNITMYVDSSISLNYETDPSNATMDLNWISSDINIVTVNNGLVYAKAPGEATVYVNKGDISRKIDINVIPINLLSINTSNINVFLSREETYNLNLGFVPNNATDLNLEFISDNPLVATVDKGVITAKDVGNTIIKVKSNDIELEINVEVR